MTLKAKPTPLPPLLKYPGGKEKELKFILPALPEKARYYYEPFVGAGSVYLAVSADKYFINDKSAELMGIYRMAAHADARFFDPLCTIDADWQYISRIAERYREEFLSLYQHSKAPSSPEEDVYYPVRMVLSAIRHSLFPELLSERPSYLADPLFWDFAEKRFQNKFPRMKKLEETKGPLTDEDLVANLEGCLKSALYLYLRSRYNERKSLHLEDGEWFALYFYLREYCYSSMFRYNRNGEFNVPYGGISYNKKVLTGKIEALKSPDFLDQLSRTIITEMDFEDFVAECTPDYEDYLFLDPPYDTEFASYDGNEFAKEDHIRLASYLKEICQSYFMLVIKNTDFIRDLYPEGILTASGRPLYVYRFDTKYFVSFMSRNDRHTQHLMITNYPVPLNLSLLSEGEGSLN
ncbi:MAG: DNA adenine methylase [Lachnospiraceae bacterium]|nr:DNA adenine methylase [Lachnospiraceae bacterium]